MATHTARHVKKESLSDMELKEAGNQYFMAKKYDEALDCYSEAIRKNPSSAILYTNRGMALHRLRNMRGAVTDLRKALELDPIHMKAHFFLGKSLCELNQLDEGISHLQKAMELSRDQRLNFGDELAKFLRLYRKSRFSLQDEKRMQKESELQTYLKRLVTEDHTRRREEAQDVDVDNNETADTVASKLTEIEASLKTNLRDINYIFSKVDEQAKKREVPDYLCGKISFDLLRDPIVTPSGITYERKDIEEHLMRVGHFDPVTRVALTTDQLIPNYAMKEVVDAFVAENPWALDL